MGYGATGRILRVDLTRMHCHTEQLDEDVYRLYPGGKALAGYFMLREFVPGTDALSPDSVLVVANGLLTGAPVSTAARFTVAARSPLTAAYGDSEAGGYSRPELKAAGYEAKIVPGRAAAAGRGAAQARGGDAGCPAHPGDRVDCARGRQRPRGLP